MNDEWYESGLCFSCQQCGNCCSGQSGYVWLSWDELKNIDEYLQKNNLQHISHYIRRIGTRFSLVEKPNGDCVFLTRNLAQKTECSINPVKPKQCKTWPFWETLLESEKAWNEASIECPGINTGKSYTFEEIEKMKDLHN